jgi:hypothetical protein
MGGLRGPTSQGGRLTHKAKLADFALLTSGRLHGSTPPPGRMPVRAGRCGTPIGLYSDYLPRLFGWVLSIHDSTGRRDMVPPWIDAEPAVLHLETCLHQLARRWKSTGAKRIA